MGSDFMVKIRPYQSGDEKQILPLFKEVFAKDREESHWRWQFLENPASKPIIILAEDTERIVGQCTLLPTKMIAQNQEMLAGQSIDTMLSKSHRGQGLHKQMADETYRIALEDQIQFRIGFPSQDALRGLLGGIGSTLVTEIPLYTHIYKLDSLFLPIVKLKPLAVLFSRLGTGILNFGHRVKKIKPDSPYTLKEITEFDTSFDELAQQLLKEGQVMAQRSSDFLNWRIAKHPEYEYTTYAAYQDNQLRGYIILKLEDRKIKGRFDTKFGSIVDLIGLNQEIVEVLYARAQSYFRQNQTDFVVTWMTENMKHKNVLTRMGFRKSKSTIPFVVKTLVENEALDQEIKEEKNWYLMPIESDFY